MYVVDTGAFFSFGNYFPQHFPDFWKRVNLLAENGKFVSTREVRREIKGNFPFDHIVEWVKNHGDIFLVPSLEEQKIVRDLFALEKNRNLVRQQHILKGMPVADPFIIAMAKSRGAKVITRELAKPGATKIPNICADQKIECIGVEQFLDLEKLVFRSTNS